MSECLCDEPADTSCDECDFAMCENCAVKCGTCSGTFCDECSRDVGGEHDTEMMCDGCYADACADFDHEREMEILRRVSYQW